MAEDQNRQSLQLTLLLQLQQRARRASREELPFAMLNETKALVPYQQALLWDPGTGRKGRIQLISGVSVPDANSPLLTALNQLLPHAPLQQPPAALQSFVGADFNAEQAAQWRQWLPEHALWMPLQGPAGDTVGVLLFARREPWQEGEMRLFEHLGDAYGHAYAYARLKYRPSTTPDRPGRRRLRILLPVAALVALGFLPLRQSVLAPAEVVPRRPTLVRAPLDGIVDRFWVEPNQRVRAGQDLFALDGTHLQNRLSVAEKTRDIARTEYLQAQQQAFADPRVQAQLAILQERIEQQDAEVEYYAGLLERIQVKAPADGIAVFDDPYDWLGRPVTIGQKILLVADPEDTELELSLPTGDALDLPLGSEVSFYLNTAPVRPLGARLNFASYTSFTTPENTTAYRLRAAFDNPQARPRLGLQGTGKIYGERTLLALWVLRKPLNTMRRWLGL